MDIADCLLVQYGFGVVCFTDGDWSLGILADDADYRQVADNLVAGNAFRAVGGDDVDVQGIVCPHGQAILGHHQPFAVQGQYRPQPHQVRRRIVQSAERVDGALIFDGFRFVAQCQPAVGYFISVEGMAEKLCTVGCTGDG